LLLPLSPTSSVRLRPPPSPSLFPYTTLFRSISQSQPSVPVQAATPPHVGVRDEDGADEQEHLDKPEQTEQIEGHGPRVEEDDLDVEDDEQHRGQIELDREPLAPDRLRRRLDPALVRLKIGRAHV